MLLICLVIVVQMLADCDVIMCAKLVAFTLQVYIHHDIRGYTPVAGDLAYPDKLLLTAGLNDKQSDTDSVFGPSGTEVRSCYLITLQCSLHYLKQLSQRV